MYFAKGILHIRFFFSRPPCGCVFHASTLHTGVDRFRRMQGNEADFGRGRTIGRRSSVNLWRQGRMAGNAGRREMEISASSVSLFDVATCPKLGSTTELPPSPSGSAGIKESALGLTPYQLPLSRIPAGVPYYTASQLNFFRRGERERGEKDVAAQRGMETRDALPKNTKVGQTR